MFKVEYIEGYNNGDGVWCKKCGISHVISWSTEYGDPLDGDFELKCKQCNTLIKFNVETTTTYTVI